MTAEPVWCLFRVFPQDSLKVQEAFDKAIKQSKIADKLQRYLRDRETRSPTFQHQLIEIFETVRPRAIANISDMFDLFDWEDMDQTLPFFLHKAFQKMIENLFKTAKSRTMSVSMDEAIIDLIPVNDFCASQFLYAGLGWKQALKLPGCCGNMFIAPEELETTLIDIEQIFEEVDEQNFFDRAYAVGGEDSDLEKLFHLPLVLSKVLREGNGFLALNYPHL